MALWLQEVSNLPLSISHYLFLASAYIVIMLSLAHEKKVILESNAYPKMCQSCRRRLLKSVVPKVNQ